MLIMYRKSNYLIKKISKEKDMYFLYHSIFGNFIKLNNELYNYLFSKEYFSELELKSNLSKYEFEFLIKNYFLLDDEIKDEQNIVSQKLKKRKSNISLGEEFDKLQLILTNSCNFNCKYCFCNHFVREKINNFMTFEIAEKSILKSLQIIKKNNKKNLTISFFGGEPSLNLQVIKKILLKFQNYFEGVNITYEYTSNGSIMNLEIAELFFSYKVLVSFSIDYLEPEDLSYRGDGSNLYSWEKIENNIKLLTEKEVAVEVSSVLSTETFNKNFYFLVDNLKKYNIQRMFLILSFDTEFYKIFSKNQIVEKIFDYYLYCLKKDISLEGYWYDTFSLIIDSDKFKEREAYKTCPSIGKMLSIEPNGDIFACKTTNVNLGNIDTLEEIFKQDKYHHYAMRAYINSEECKGCEIQGFCSGNCAGSNENNFGTIYKVNPMFCNVMKSIVSKLLDFYIEY